MTGSYIAELELQMKIRASRREIARVAAMTDDEIKSDLQYVEAWKENHHRDWLREIEEKRSLPGLFARLRQRWCI
jgi:hypothetical protein